VKEQRMAKAKLDLENKLLRKKLGAAGGREGQVI
jgi:hypothetical protein